MIMLTICEFLGHRVNRRRVWHDGLNYRSRCKRCRHDLLRQQKGWALYDPAAHADERREAEGQGGIQSL